MKNGLLGAAFAALLSFGAHAMATISLEDFEGETGGATSFSNDDDTKTFNITSSSGERYDVFLNGTTTPSGTDQCPNCGWNGTQADQQFVDNAGDIQDAGNGTSFTIATSDGSEVSIKSLYLYTATINTAVLAHTGTLTIEGRADDNSVYTITKTTGFNTDISANNGFTLIDFSSEGGTNNSTLGIDELVFTATGNLDYLALDAFRWDTNSTSPTDPEIDIQGNAQTISDGDTTPSVSDHTDFGNHFIGGNNFVRTFTIENSGTGALDFTGTPNVVISGSSDFSVTSQPATDPLPAGNTTTFQITLDPTTSGLQQADISIANDDADETPYNFRVQANVTATDSDGSLTASTTVAEPVGVDTTIDTVDESVDVLDFILSDGGGSDGLALGVSQLVVNVSGSSTDAERAQVTWSLSGPDANNVAGVYASLGGGNGTITFSNLLISVANGTNEEYRVNAYFNDNTSIQEDRTFILSIDGDTNAVTTAGGTTMGATSPVTNIGGTWDVVATRMVFTTQAAGLVSGIAAATQPIVAAQDSFGNVDRDFTENVTISFSPGGGTDPVSEQNNVVAAVNGVATFTGFGLVVIVDGRGVLISANDQDGVGSNLTPVNSNLLFVDIVATKLMFDTQPAPLTLVDGFTTNFTATPVVSARDANNAIDSDYSSAITISEVNGAGTATISATGDTDSSAATVTLNASAGQATFNGLAMTYNSSTGSTENFNLQATSGALNTANSSQLTANGLPTISSATYDGSTGNLVVSGTNFVANPASADVNVGLLSITGQAGGSHTLTTSSDVEITNASQFTVSITGNDKAAIDALINEDGLSSEDATSYNLAAADDFITAITNGNSADLTGNSISASNTDLSPPVVQSITISGSPAANATSVTFTVSFDENANNISVDDFVLTDTGTAAASIGSVSASSGTSVDVVVNSISGTGTVRLDVRANTNITDDSANGNGINGSLAAFTSGPSHTADLDAPTVTSVTVPANGTYIENQALDLTVNFSENVEVNTTGGTPRITLNIGASAVIAAYQSGTNTSSLLFRYTVSNGDLDADGIAIGALSDGGGTLSDSAGNTAELTLSSVPTTSAVLVDAVAPRLQSITRQNPVAETTSADSVILRYTFDENVTGVQNSNFTTDSPTVITSVTNNAVSASVYDVTFAGPALAAFNGQIQFGFTTQGISDTAGNSMTNAVVVGTNENNYTFDNVSPAAPVVSVPSAAITVNTASQSISGTHSGGSSISIELFADSNNDGTADNDTILDSSSVTNGNWALTSNLSAGENNFVVVAKKVGLGLVSGAVNVPTITLDTQVPTLIRSNGASGAGIELFQGDTEIEIASTSLFAIDNLSGPDQIIYTIQTPPSNGTLRLLGQALAQGSMFSQASVNANALSYDHSGSNTTADAFEYSVADFAGNVLLDTGDSNFQFTFSITDFALGDEDGDGVLNGQDNCIYTENADQADLDQDDKGDACDGDIDGDRLPNAWEERNGLNPRDPSDANGDPDGDGFSNEEEYRYVTDPNEFDPDENGDGIPDDRGAPRSLSTALWILLMED